MAQQPVNSGINEGRIEEIVFNEGEGQDSFLIRDNSFIVNIHPSRSAQRHKNSKLKFQNIVDYKWDIEYGNGQIVATHISGKYIAYIVKSQNGGGVRLLDTGTNERVLLRGGPGLIKDVEFAHKLTEIIIGFIDEFGSFFVYKIFKEKEVMGPKLILQVNCSENIRCDTRRFIWCKYVPEDPKVALKGYRDCSMHFVVLQDDTIHISNLNHIVETFGEGPVKMNELERYFLEITAHSSTVYDASFAPDGTALATCSKDGTVKFFQVYLLGKETPRCLYSWAPHEGKPVTKILFLDDYQIKDSSNSDSQYWKFMLTAGENMTEIKVWTCKSWYCLQTINFISASPSQYKMELDITANHLLLADIRRKNLFAMKIEQDDDKARLAWVSEFSLPFNIISFNLRVSKLMTLKEITNNGIENYIPNESLRTGEGDLFCFFEIFFIQMKSLQMGSLGFRLPNRFYKPKSQSKSKITLEMDRLDEFINLQDNDKTEDLLELVGDDYEKESKDLTEKIIKLTHSHNNSHSHKEEAEELSSSGSFSSSPVKNNENDLLLPLPPIGSPPPVLNMNSLVSPITPSLTPVNNNKSLLSEQLSNLIGIGGGIGILGGGSPQLRKTPEKVFQHVSVSFSSSRESPPHHDINGQKLSTSSSPSREVEEILSPKNTHVPREPSPLGIISPLINLDNNNFVQVQSNMKEISGAKSIHSVLTNNKSGTEEGLLPQMPQVLNTVNSIMEMVKSQSQELNELKRELARLNSEQRAMALNSRNSLDEATLTRILDKNSNVTHSAIKRLEDSMKNVELGSERQINARIPSNILEVLSANINNQVKHEIESVVLPRLLKVFEPAQNQLELGIESMVKVAEGRIKNELRLLVQSKTYRDNLLTELNTATRLICEKSIQDNFTRSIVPSFEKGLQDIFTQINATFTEGTKEYLTGLESALQLKDHKSDDRTEEVLKQQFTDFQDNITIALHDEVESQMLGFLNSLQKSVVKQIEDIRRSKSGPNPFD